MINMSPDYHDLSQIHISLLSGRGRRRGGPGRARRPDVRPQPQAVPHGVPTRLLQTGMDARIRSQVYACHHQT